MSKHETIIYTNHSVTLDIVKQIFLNIIITDKLNLCLIQVSQYIQIFRLKIFHKSDKTHLVSDALSRLSNKAFSDDIESLNVLHANVQYTATIVQLSKEFRR